MDLIGEFQKVEIDGKPFLVHHTVIKPSPQTHTPNSKIAIDSFPQPLFLCPRYRTRILLDSLEDMYIEPQDEFFFKYETSPLFDDTSNGHHVLPLFWCNNKEVDPNDEDCYNCSIQTIGTHYYFCITCDKRFHKECVESPLEISHPSHTKHTIQLYYSKNRSDNCIYCAKRAAFRVYYCSLCETYMHAFCALANIPLSINQPKRHDHALTFFPRQDCLTCNLCGLVNKLYLTYVCPSVCDFVAHTHCIKIPQIIRISRHHHRVSFTSSLPLGKWSCGVCRRNIDCDYGSYTCKVCSGYAVHTRCALRKDIWDAIDLEGVPEDGFVEPPFVRISEGVILHFSHGCHLELKTNDRVYDGEKFCQACALPIYEKNFYECVKCKFILHERCADAPREKVHPLHPHPLQQKVANLESKFYCYACKRPSTSFRYECGNKDCDCVLDVVCASISEPFNYQGHQHPLFLSLDPKEKPVCHICNSNEVGKVLNCIECDFIICFRCATLPYMVRYKHDDHYLTFCRGDEANSSDWCEICEKKLAVGGEKGFYSCNDCCTTLHIKCLLGPHPYLKPGETFGAAFGKMLVHRNNSASRPICHECNIRCPYPTYVEHITYQTKFLCKFSCYVPRYSVWDTPM